MRALGLCLVLLGLGGCGYTSSAARPDGASQRLWVAPIREPGLHVDTGALVEEAVRQAIVRSAGLALVDAGAAEGRLELELLSGAAGLEAFAQPDRRAGQYRASVQLRGQLFGADGRLRWSSPVVLGEAEYLSTAGALESLDGAERRGLARAAETAAERLATALTLHLRRRPL